MKNFNPKTVIRTEVNSKNVKIFAIDSKNNWEEIKNLYWFEEYGVRDFNGEGHLDIYKFVIEIENI